EKVDITIPAQKFLSCIKRTDEIFGAGHIIDVLRGSQAKKIFKFGHQDLSTYGIGSDYSKKQWFHLSRQFLHQELVVQDMEYGSLKLTDKAWDVLQGRQTVLGRLQEDEANNISDNESEEDATLGYDRDLLAILKNMRKTLADNANLPPYVIFHDRTLIEMSTYFPHSLERMLDVYGIGEGKLEKYGGIFLDVIIEYCRQHQIEERPKALSRRQKSIVKPLQRRKHHIVGDLYNTGRSIPEIMSEFGIKQTTALDHLYKYIQDGNSLDSDEMINNSTIPQEQRDAVLEAFARFGHELLRPVFDALEGRINYEELKIIRLYYLYKNNVALSNIQSENPDQSKESGIYKQIVCLANSRKYSGRCIAGKEILKDKNHALEDDLDVDMVGGWIRPISAQKTGEFSINSITLTNGKNPELLDIISIPIAKHSPNHCQTENYLIDEGPWVKTGNFPLTALSALCDYVDSLWINNHSSSFGLNDRIPVDLINASLKSSLLLIKLNKLSIVVEEDAKMLKKVRAEFDFKGERYRLLVTDPIVEGIYLKKEFGSYSILSNDLYVSIYISEPFNGYCYKLVAGIIPNIVLT
ncbi:MAG: RQC domain-containing protein, partial [Spirochaetota bacterium]|nr:RQC domain-containing protein [Spirochaetota bacterium]